MDLSKLKGDITVEELLQYGWPDKKDPGKSDTKQKAFENHVCRYFGKMLVRKFGSTQILKVIDIMKNEKHLDNKTINSVLRTGRALGDVAVAAHIIEENSWKNVDYLPTDDDNSTKQPIAEEELAKIKAQLPGNFMGNYYKMLLLKDTRNIAPNMLLTAQVQDFDPEAGTLTLHGTLTGNKGVYKPHYPVTIHLSSEGIAVIQDELKFRQYKKEHCAEGEWVDDPDFIWCTWTGRHVDVNIRNSCMKNIQLMTGFDWVTAQRLHGHVLSTERAA